MKFRAHDTFFIRKGWLYKGLKNVKINPAVFIGDNGNPMDILGIGSNMVKSLRYWLKTVRLTSEPTTGKRFQSFTSFGECIYNNDKYMEEMGTLWLLHYMLVTNKEEATAWYFFYNEFKLNEFTRDDFVVQLSNYIRLHGDEVSERSLDDDFNCIINTYLSKSKTSSIQTQPENNIECPLDELELLGIVSKKNKLYKKNIPNIDSLHPLIVLSVILEQANNQKEVKISSLQNDKNNIGKVFNLDIIALITLLTKIEHLGFIKVVRTAGLDVIKITTEMTFLDCINEYYLMINS